MSKKNKIRLIFITIVLAIAAFIAYKTPHKKTQTHNIEPMSSNISIKSNFSLIDEQGERVTGYDFMGKYQLVFFGFTHCNDICPTQLYVITDTLELLGKKANQITPIFITVDPERDTPEIMKTYTDKFHPRMVGLTGSPQNIKNTLKNFRVYAQKPRMDMDMDKGQHAQHMDTYQVDHSALVYLFAPDQSYVTHFTSHDTAETMSKKLAKIIK